MKKGKKESTKKEISLERDFEAEYMQLFERLGHDYKLMEEDWNKKSSHIKKFSLLKNNPAPIISFNSSPLT